MIGWYDASASLLSYVVVTRRWEKVVQMSAASLWSYWQGFVKKTTCASQLQPLGGTVLLPQAPCGRGKGHQCGGEGESALSYTHSPIMVRKGGVGWMNHTEMSLPLWLGGYPPSQGLLELRVMHPVKTCSAPWAKQIRYDSRGLRACVASVSSLGPPGCPQVVTPACTLWNHSERNGCDSDAAILRECGKGHKVKPVEIT